MRRTWRYHIGARATYFRRSFGPGRLFIWQFAPRQCRSGNRNEIITSRQVRRRWARRPRTGGCRNGVECAGPVRWSRRGRRTDDAGAADSTRREAARSTEVPGAAKNYAVPKTPWGDPDLQGIWPGIELVGVPMQRPANFGARNWLTEEEFKQRQANRRAAGAAGQRRVRSRRRDQHPGGDVGGPVSPPPHWLERGKPQHVARSSSIRWMGGSRRRRRTRSSAGPRAGRAQLGRGPADSYSDRSLYDRCITRGIAGSFLPVIYNNGNESCRGPGGWRMRNEMIHETRIVPLDARPHSVRRSRHSWATRAGIGKATPWSSRRRISTARRGSAPTVGRADQDRSRSSSGSRASIPTRSYEVDVDRPKTWTRPWKIGFR